MGPQEAVKRNDQIFHFIVRSYIDTAEPVGSRTISKKCDLGLSPASIRNVMADLEEQGLLMHPHTSAGRVPTDKGYRYYVDNLMEPKELSEKEKHWVLEELQKARTVEALAGRVSKVISEMTGNTAVIYIRNLKRVSFLNHLLDELVRAQKLADFFEEDSELFFDGAFRMLSQPEFRDANKMRLFLQVMDDKVSFVQILARDLEEEGVQVHIGRENHLGALDDVSLVVKDCYVGNSPIGGVAVVGPTRMNYPKAVSVVDFVADMISNAIGRY